MNLPLPLKARLFFGWKRVLLYGLLILVVLAAIVLVFVGRIDMIQRLWLRATVKRLDLELETLAAKKKANSEAIEKNAEEFKKLEEVFKTLEARQVASTLAVKGMSYEQIVDELRRRNF